jgi:hypothetical protein
MKKILYSVLALGLTLSAQAQEAADKDFQAGIVLGAGMNFQKMGTKAIESAGVGSDLTIGANLNFSLTNTIAFNTGVEFDFDAIKFDYAQDGKPSIYYRYNDTEILQKGDTPNLATDSYFQLANRSQKSVYLTIPTMLVFRTNFIGYFRYFGKFGLRNSFLLSTKSNDDGFNFGPGFTNGDDTKNEGMKASRELAIFKSAVGLAGGAEWNFSGSTCLVAEIGYYYGFTPLYPWFRKADSDNATLYTRKEENGTLSDAYLINKATQGQLMFKVSILF